MAKRKAAHSLSKPQSVEAFRAWLTGCGAELLDPTNPYEVVRFRSGAGVSVVYRCERTSQNSMTNLAEEAWTTFKAGGVLDLSILHVDECSRPIPSTDEAILGHAAAGPITIAFLMNLDLAPMREAAGRLFGLERGGHLVRSGGEPGTALVWRTPEASDVR